MSSLKKHWLDVAEYVSVAGAVVGSVVGTVSGQVIYATLPLTLCIGLNIANRHRLTRSQLPQTTLVSETVNPTTQTNSPQKSEPPTETNSLSLKYHIIITTFLFVIIGFSILFLRSWATKIGTDWVPELAKPSLTIGSDSAKARAQEQLTEIVDRANRHRTAFIFFQRDYFVSLSMALGAGNITAICLFLIKWDKPNPYILNIVIISTSVAVIMTNIPQVFKHEENIESHKSLYLQYVALYNQVKTYLLSRVNEEGKGEKIESFIVRLDTKINELNQLSLKYDARQIPEVKNLLQQQQNAPPPPTNKKS